MSVRPPRSLTGRSETPLSPLEIELASERADALGRAGMKVEAALAALSRCEDDGARREALLYAAADAVWSFFIQREICGLRNSGDLISRYTIPTEVLARMGAKREPPTK